MARRTEEQEQTRQVDHPYAELEGTVIWKAVDKAVRDLVENGDLQEKTARVYLVGYIAQLVTKAQEKSSRKSAGEAVRKALTGTKKAGKLLRDIEKSLAEAS